VTEIGVPDPLEPEIEIVPAVDPVPGPAELPEPVPAPLREPERVPADPPRADPRFPWTPQQTFAAECPDHRRPTPACGCGIYAVTTREAALEWASWAQSALTHPIVIGQVQLWGRALPHSAGYRPRLAYPGEDPRLRTRAPGRLRPPTT